MKQLPLFKLTETVTRSDGSVYEVKRVKRGGQLYEVAVLPRRK